MIRKATIEDGKAVYDMAFAYWREANETGKCPFPWDSERAVIHIGNKLWSEKGLSFISENGEGAILGEIGETWFGPTKMAQPSILYVKPEHRNGLIARALLRRFEAEAIKVGAKIILWEFETAITDCRILGGLMKKLKFEYQGPIYKKFIGGNDHASDSGIYPVDNSGCSSLT